MSKYSCDVIQDLLALYHDEVCSEESRRVVEEHLAECESCSAVAKQLENTELESNIAEQTENIVRKHRKKENKKLRIVLIVASSVILAVVLFFVIVPRIGLSVALNEYVPFVGEAAEYYTEYAVTDDSLVVVDAEHCTIGIPADFVKKDLSAEFTSVYYHDPDNDGLSVMIVEPQDDLERLSLFYRGHYENVSDEQYELIISVLEKWYDALGHGIPDTAYDTYKGVHLLDESDRGFWNMGRSIAFGITGILKLQMPMFGDYFIYETDEMCGFVSVGDHTDEGYYYVTAEMYSVDDLNQPYNFIIRTKTAEEAYAIVNSITIK